MRYTDTEPDISRCNYRFIFPIWYSLFQELLHSPLAPPSQRPMAFPSVHVVRPARDIEGIKRAREEYQMMLCDHPLQKCQRTSTHTFPSCASVTPVGAPATPSVFQPEVQASLSTLVGSCTVFPQSSTIELTRADTGKMVTFVFCPSVTYTWDRRGEFYHSIAGERVGYELQETIKASVMPCLPSMGSQSAIATSAWQTPATSRRPCGVDAFSVNEESDDGLPQPSQGCDCRCNTARWDTNPRPYFFEVSQVSRTLQPPPLMSSFNDVRDGGSAWYSQSTPSLVVDCLLKCAVEEAQLRDAAAWAFLYKGRHLHTESGKDLIGRDLLRQAAPATELLPNGPRLQGASAATAVSLCAFRRF